MSLADFDYPDDQMKLDLRWWAAANYLTVAQIYLRDNPLLRVRLRADHIKPRLLGHWGTSPALSLIYVALNRLIRSTGQDCIYITGPGHGGPALVANAYLEGRYSEVYPLISQDVDGLTRLVRQFSSPGGIPSHVSVQTPGSIHEGGELGYALVHAAGAAFDHPDLLVASSTDVVFAFHGYPRAIHELLHGRSQPGRFHVRGFSEQGTTTTPFDMVVLNRMSRYHLTLEALRRARRVAERGAELAEYCRAQLEKHPAYVREHLEDMPEVRNWIWPG